MAAIRPANSQRRSTVWYCLGVLLLVVVAYLPVLNNNFIFWDDQDYVTANPHVQSGLTLESIKWAMSSTVGGNWHPLTWLSHMLDCQWFGLNPRGHHLTNLLLHAVNTVLLLLVLTQMTGAPARSFFVAAMFGLHPMHVESVAWVSERKDVLSTFFGLLALIFYARFAQQKEASSKQQGAPVSLIPSPYFWSLFFFALSLLSKPMLVTFPCVLLLLDYWPLRRFKTQGRLKLLVEKIPFFLCSTAICVVTVLAQKRMGGMRTTASFPLSARVENALVAYCRYLGKLFWPINLPFFYPHPGHWPPLTVAGAAALLLGLFYWAWRMRHNHPYVLVGWCWFVGTLVPVIGLVQVGFQSIANRYSYVPFIGIFLLLAWGLPTLIQHWRHHFFISFILTAAAISICLPLTRRQIGYWKDSEILYRYASAIIDNNWEAHARLGLVLSKQGRMDEAIDEYRLALTVKPDDTDARYDLANVLCRKGMWDEAVGQYQEELKLNPDDFSGHNNLGVALLRRQRPDEAIAQFREALRLNPNDMDAQKNLLAAEKFNHADTSSPVLSNGPAR